MGRPVLKLAALIHGTAIRRCVYRSRPKRHRGWISIARPIHFGTNSPTQSAHSIVVVVFLPRLTFYSRCRAHDVVIARRRGAADRGERRQTAGCAPQVVIVSGLSTPLRRCPFERIADSTRTSASCPRSA